MKAQTWWKFHTNNQPTMLWAKKHPKMTGSTRFANNFLMINGRVKARHALNKLYYIPICMQHYFEVINIQISLNPLYIPRVCVKITWNFIQLPLLLMFWIGKYWIFSSKRWNDWPTPRSMLWIKKSILFYFVILNQLQSVANPFWRGPHFINNYFWLMWLHWTLNIIAHHERELKFWKFQTVCVCLCIIYLWSNLLDQRWGTSSHHPPFWMYVCLFVKKRGYLLTFPSYETLIEAKCLIITSTTIQLLFFYSKYQSSANSTL